jgi:hypothetical protein
LRVVLQPFDDAAWENCNAPGIFDGCLRDLGVRPSARKWRLLLCEFARRAFSEFHKVSLFARALELGELWADSGREPRDAALVRRKLLQPGAPREAWVGGASWCVAEHPPSPRVPGLRPALADVYRELLPNPLRTLEWKTAWFTSTVRALAAQIYARQEFGALPILADALQDAGCDDEQILTHCRATKPHARGCWVLDAVLGKT